jgi:dihydrofolate synthase/folylpolyglutamate synthase
LRHRPFGRPRARGTVSRAEGCSGAPRALPTGRLLTTSIGDALAWLDRHVNLEAIEAGTAGRYAAPSLERIGALTDAMGAPQSAFPAIHVTGTNGKGSTTRMAAALLGESGLRTGSYTSPHLERLNERLAIAGEPISDDDLAEQLEALRGLEEFLEVRPTWFELVTAAAFRWFADEAVDACVVEVGLGGRFDATNVLDAAVSVVTNVELDHTEILGGTRAQIAAEKAGIIKPGGVVVCGETDDALAAVFEAEARAVGAASVWRLGPDFGASNIRIAVGGRACDLSTPAGRYEDIFLPLRGAHQCVNAAVALASAQAFLGDVIADDLVREAFAGVTVPGRLEVLGRRPFVVLDGAHNPVGARATRDALAEDFESARRIVVVMGCLKRRDPAALLGELRDERLATVVACTPPSPRAMPGAELADAASLLGIDAEDGGDVTEAVERALELTGEDDLLLVTGSLYVVGAARTALADLL